MKLTDVRHDFINNALRIEILNKMICEDLEKNKQPNDEFVKDLTKFLEDHLQFLKQTEI